MKQAHQYVNQTSGKEDWMTPLDIVERARRTMGGIDLDPASSALANERVKAAEFFTQEDDGLRRRWWGRVWLNHPWGRRELPCLPDCQKKQCLKRGWHRDRLFPGNEAWIQSLTDAYDLGEVKQACCIVFNSTSETWFRSLLDYPMCILYGRTAFVDPAMRKPVTSPPKGCIVFYLGERVNAFEENFYDIGSIYVPRYMCRPKL